MPVKRIAEPAATRLWKLYLGFGLVAIVGHFVLDHGDAQGVVYLLVAASGVLALVVGVHRNRPEPPTPWHLLGAGLTLFLAGDVLFYFYKLVRDIDRPFPSLADAFYLGSYPLQILGLLAIIRRRTPGGDRAGLIDACIIATGVGLVAQVYLIGPLVTADTPWPERAISAAYPVADVALLAVAARLALAGGRRAPGYRFLGVAMACLLAADVGYSLVQLTGSFELGTPYDAGWLGFYLFCGLAALHPSMGSVTQPEDRPEPAVSPLRVLALSAVVLIAPAVLVANVVSGRSRDLLVIAGASVVLFVLVMARVGQLMAALRATAARDRALLAAAGALVAATDREEICAAAEPAVRELVGDPDAVVRVALWTGACGPVRSPGRRTGSTPATGAGDVPVAGGTGRDAAPRELDAVVRELLADSDGRECVTRPVVLADGARGAIVVTSANPVAPEHLQALDILSSQLAMALESVALTEDQQRRRSEARFASMVENSSDVITLVDVDTTMRYLTPSVRQVLGYEPEELVASRLVDLVHPSDLARALAFFDDVAAVVGTSAPVEMRVRRHDGSWVDVEVSGNNLVADPNVGGIVMTVRDVSERRSLERELVHQAFHDPLTGLANRALFMDRCEQAHRRAARDAPAAAVLFVDLDDFKAINDGFGHNTGDLLLMEFAARLRSCVRPLDTVARLGSDEFVVLLEEVGEPEVACRTAQRILDGLAEPFTLGDTRTTVRASIGIAFADSECTGGEELLRNADMAMYTAKSRKRGGYELFEAPMRAMALDRLNGKAELQRALEREEFVLHFQPIVRLGSGRVVGFEALLRWAHPDRGLVGPFEFISLAEQTGLIVPLGRWVLEAACHQARLWHEVHGTTMSVNVSLRQLADPNLVDDVATIMATTGVNPAALTLEVTESVLVHDIDATVAVLDQLRDLGVRVAMDDFGTGYSSLSALRRLPVDVLKIDKSFVDGIGSSSEDSVLVAKVLELAHGLQLTTVAEGIEDQAQLERLRELGSDLGQGYHFARPLPAAEAEELIGPTRELPPRGESVRRARAFLATTLQRWGLEALVDPAVLLASELVTNSVLQTPSDVVVAVRRTVGAVRVEVLDGSAARPTLIPLDEDAATGRGLRLVEALSTAWGVERRPGGKAVWFELAVEEGDGPAAMVHASEQLQLPLPAPDADDGDVRIVQFRHVPVALTWEAIQHSEELLRELTLLALDDPPPSAPRSAATLDLTPLMLDIREARRRGEEYLDLDMALPVSAREAVEQRLALMTHAERLARERVLLCPPGRREVGAFRQWFLSEIAAQLGGEGPTRWPVRRDGRRS